MTTPNPTAPQTGILGNYVSPLWGWMDEQDDWDRDLVPESMVMQVDHAYDRLIRATHALEGATANIKQQEASHVQSLQRYSLSPGASGSSVLSSVAAKLTAAEAAYTALVEAAVLMHHHAEVVA